jgi:hypothetical protein
MRVSRIFLDELADFVAIAHGHKHIREHKIGVYVGKAPDGGFAVAHSHYINSALFQRQHDHFLDIGIVVCNQNSGHCLPLEASPDGDTPTPFILYCSIPKRGRQQTRSTGVLELLAGSKQALTRE